MAEARYSIVLPTGPDDSKEPKIIKRRNNQKSSLHRANMIFFLLYTGLFVTLLAVAVIYKGNALETELTTDFRTYVPPFTGTTLRSLCYYPLVFVIVPVAGLAAFYHGLLAIHEGLRSRYHTQVLVEERNDLKWIEYGVTNALISWVVLQLCGATNVLVLAVAGAALSVAIQYASHLMELLNTPRQRQMRNHHTDWTPVWQGATLFTVQWAITWIYFFALVTSEHTALFPRVPWYIYVIPIGHFFLSGALGALLVLHYAFTSSRNVGYHTELAYMALSFMLKTFVIVVFLVAVIATPAP